MSLVRVVRSAVMRRLVDSGRAGQRRLRAEQARTRAGRPHQVYYFHQPDDPYSHLAAQALRPFLDRFDVQLHPCIVAEATPIAIHQKALWDALARRECAAMAPYYGLSYRDPGSEPQAALVEKARRLLLNVRDVPGFPELAVAVGAAIHAQDADALDRLKDAHGLMDVSAAQRQLRKNFALRHRLGHYLGAMFFYEGEWYWGIDRLHYLEARLESLGARRANAPAGPSAQLTARAPQRIKSAQRIRLEYFASLRSPYSHISYERVGDLCRRYPVDLVVRPVLPMMMRGVKADRRKGVYIMQDTKREADRLGVPFGNIWDPFGAPVKRAYSLFPWARDQGRGFEYLKSYSYAVWGERVNAWNAPGLRMIVERAGLSWSDAKKLLDNRDWEPELERNVTDMLTAGSWGVPTLRLPAAGGAAEFTVWGQDRIWLMEEEIARRLGH